MKEIVVGKRYRGLPVEFENEMSGIVMKVYENTVLMLVEDYTAKKDRVALLDKHNRVIVRKENILEELNTPAVAA